MTRLGLSDDRCASEGPRDRGTEPGSLATWLPGYLDTWLPGYLATWLPGCLAAWLPGCLAAWLPGSGNVNPGRAEQLTYVAEVAPIRSLCQRPPPECHIVIEYLDFLDLGVNAKTGPQGEDCQSRQDSHFQIWTRIADVTVRGWRWSPTFIN